MGLGCGAQDSRPGVQGLGFRVWGLEFRVWGLEFRAWGLVFGSWSLGCRAQAEMKASDAILHSSDDRQQLEAPFTGLLLRNLNYVS